MGFIKLWGLPTEVYSQVNRGKEDTGEETVGREVYQENSKRLVKEFTASIGFDHLLFEEDIRGSVAHARMLGACGILTPEEAERRSSEGSAGSGTGCGPVRLSFPSSTKIST